MYILHPPIFKEEYGLSFGESWEIFTLKLLKIHYKTNNIKKRNPPESGIDLYFPEKKIAFQCKSIAEENGKFNYTKVQKSLEDALKIQKELGWQKFIICTNCEETGKHIEKLKKIYKDIEIYSKHFWIYICENNPEVIQNNFRKIIDVPSAYQANKFKNISKIPLEIKEIIMNKHDFFSIWLYVNQTHDLIPIDVCLDMTVEHLLNLVKGILGITSKTFIQHEEVLVSCQLYYQGIYINESDKTLADIRIKQGEVVSLDIKIELPDIIVSTLMLKDNQNLVRGYLMERKQFLLNSIHSYLKRGY